VLPVRLTARVLHRNGVTEVRLSGDLTASTSSALLEATRDRLNAGDTDVRIGLAGVAFADARGLAALLVAVRMGADVGAAVTFERPSPLVWRLLELAGAIDFVRAAARPAARAAGPPAR
jgi:anti-sigma B factor antagonist